MKSAVLTGAAMGIGRAVAERLIADGVSVPALDRNPDALASAKDGIGERYEPVVGDIGDWDAHELAAAAAKAAELHRSVMDPLEGGAEIGPGCS